jgi:hypothetical protein
MTQGFPKELRGRLPVLKKSSEKLYQDRILARYSSIYAF